jgi:hypothetical protein
MKSLKLVALPLVAVLASGCYGRSGNVGDALFAGAVAGVVIASAVHDADVQHEQALERAGTSSAMLRDLWRSAPCVEPGL